jgi:hypothetical protein
MKKHFPIIYAFFASILLGLHNRLFAYQARTGMVLGANTLTGLIPDAFEAMDTVARELVGFIPAVTFNASAARAAVGQAVKTHVAPAAAAEDITPGTTPPDTGDQVIGNRSVTITKARAVPFRWTGEEQVGINSGSGYRNVRADQIAQAIRTLVNELEADIGLLAYKASRAYGTANTTPFASNLGDPAQVRKILVDNGCPPTDLQMVINSTAGANVRTLAQLTKANEAADTTLLRQGILLPIHNFDLRESAGVANPVVGTASGATTNAAGYAVGATVLTLASAGTGTIIAGDVVTFAGDTNKYIVASGDADVSNGGTITLAAPGLRVAMSAATKAITVIAKSARNLAFHRSAIVVAARAPALPEEGDAASDRMILTDPRSGLSIEFSMYPQYRRIRYEAALAWGQEMMKPEFSSVLLGEQ